MASIRIGRTLSAALMAAVVFLAAAAVARAAGGVAVFPIPGTHYNRPQTQISFRGVTPSAIGPVQVTGSVSGVHTGHLAAHSDGDGASFLPDQPFTAGETVTVQTQLNVVGASHGTFSFAIANPYGLLPYGKLPLVDAGSNGVQHFASRPDLQPAALTVTQNHAPTAPGDIFVAPQFGPSQDGPMILDPQGKLVWFLPRPVKTNTLVTDFRVQNLHGQPVLTWWQGNTNAGHGRGEGVIFNQDYQEIATVEAGNGLDMGRHEFTITPQGDAYIVASSPIHLPGQNKPAIDSVVQEIDIATGLVLFSWHAMDHIPLSASYFTYKHAGRIFDPYHLNSVALAPDGNLIISMRNTSAVYEVDHTTGHVIWTLGGKRSSFKLGSGTGTWGQHDAIVQPDGTLTLFDDGGGPPTVHHARGVRESLDTHRMTTRLLAQFSHSPLLNTNFEGSLQELPGGDVFVGWGQQPYITEFNSHGQQDFDAHFNAPSSSYRAYRFPWSAQPPTLPALAVRPQADGSTTLYASWNGATDVARWRVLAGPAPSSLSPVGMATRTDFETRIPVHSASPYFAVQALSSSGQVLSTSNPLATPRHIAIFGHSAFVPASGYGGIPAGCFTGHACKIATTLSVGRTVIARTGSEAIGQNGAGILYFRLSGAGQRLLRHARGGLLPVTVSARDASGATATTTINLVAFYTSGSGPHRDVANSSTLKIIGVTHFVSRGWTGGILAGCVSNTPCGASATVSVGKTVIARTGTEFLGADELGYLIFTLTRQGHDILTHAPGNQLGAHVTISSGSVTATADVALVAFG